jgi:hypothetical protein
MPLVRIKTEMFEGSEVAVAAAVVVELNSMKALGASTQLTKSLPLNLKDRDAVTVA